MHNSIFLYIDYPITYIHASVLCQSECACVYKTVNMVVFFVKSNEINYPKGRALLQMFRVVPQMKSELGDQGLLMNLSPRLQND